MNSEDYEALNKYYTSEPWGKLVAGSGLTPVNVGCTARHVAKYAAGMINDLKTSLELHKQEVRNWVTACLWMHDDPTLGLKLGDSVIKGIEIVRTQRDNLRKELDSVNTQRNNYAEHLQQIAELVGHPTAPGHVVVSYVKGLLDELSALRDFLAATKTDLQAYRDAVDNQPWATDEPIGVLLDRITAELATLRADKERLEWLFQAGHSEVERTLLCSFDPDVIRAAIDAARAPAPTVDEEISRQANDGTLEKSMAGTFWVIESGPVNEPLYYSDAHAGGYWSMSIERAKRFVSRGDAEAVSRLTPWAKWMVVRITEHSLAGKDGAK